MISYPELSNQLQETYRLSALLFLFVYNDFESIIHKHNIESVLCRPCLNILRTPPDLHVPVGLRQKSNFLYKLSYLHDQHVCRLVVYSRPGGKSNSLQHGTMANDFTA